MTEETPSITPESEAYAKAKAGFELFGNPLAKYSLSRKAAADSMGLRYGYVPEDDPMIGTGKYSGALRDTIIALWLCSIPNASEQTAEQIRAKEWSVQRADRKPEDAYQAAQEWAEANGIDDTAGERFIEAYGVFLSIMSGEGKSRFAVTTTGAGPTHEETESPNA